MDFGKVSDDELSSVDFSLPKDPPGNEKILKGKRVADPKVYVGCAKWGRKEWLGKIYAKGTKEAAFLDEYIKHYNSIELNATHYQTYPPDTIAKWAVKAGSKDFLFCPKVAQSISHYGSFINADDKTNAFLRGVMAFGEHLGPIFLQVSDRFSPKTKDNLYRYLETLPKDLQFFLEVRNSKWFEAEELSTLLQTLQANKTGFIITDAAGRRDCVHMQLTIPKAFIRFVGNSLHPSDYTRIDEWVSRIAQWIDQGIKEVYFFMHMHDEAFSPELSLYLIEKLNEACQLNLPKPIFVQKQEEPKKVKGKSK